MSSPPSGPQPVFLAGRTAPPGRIEYRLMRESLVREYKRGRLGRLDVCDAQPELVRVANSLGRPTDTLCPICETEPLVHVTFAFGAGLPPGGLPIASTRELSKAARRAPEVSCYVVEVCTSCAWNHLLSVSTTGGANR